MNSCNQKHTIYTGETGIKVGMYGKSNYEEVISYDDLKSKLGL